MRFIVKLFPEITIKSRSVRLRFSKILQSNIRNVLKRIYEDTRVRMEWDKLEVKCDGATPEQAEQLIEALKCTPGIAHFLEVQESKFTDIHNIYEQVQPIWGPQLAGQTFCVRVRRIGEHDFSSLDVERYVGGGLNQHNETAGVKLKNPDVTVRMELDKDKLFIVKATHPGMGGYPIATQEDLLSLISGGFDSAVSSYMMINRGSRVHYCFFNLGGAAHEIGVKQMAYYLWDKFGSSHRVKFVSIPFEPVVGELLERVADGMMGVILKRLMMRAASQVAGKMRIQALVTGEALGQVSSQTLTNLRVIDGCTDHLIVRPLTAFDKQTIIDIARKIGTEQISITMPEYCGVISKSPTVKAVLSKVEAEEAKLSPDLIEQVLAAAKVEDIRDIGRAASEEVAEVELAGELDSHAVILDIRAPDEEEEAPLEVKGVEVSVMPFYKLATQFGDLDQSKTYHLYCAKGVMSKLQALYLHEQGFVNVKVYHP
ncbi:tRNA 4-thiouridine(8) synthase ThiI [Corallincola holothuriorum]|uniref:tRNA sulfurtransferase n=1 Tax=Corallincola holothuriorum TaxID=2282215 RepID=A0A368N436_9GAMM|nr:tRNA uracil 4-sulfurtransferase ThiI [Corallincola holothuriorum]RCU45248.1 tRNA 4-thiouridine(8) synthase ThiI [Corallincola holothuriorum]